MQDVEGEAAKKPAEAATEGIVKLALQQVTAAEAGSAAQPAAEAVNEAAPEAARQPSEEEPSSCKKRGAEHEATPGCSKRQRTDSDWGALLTILHQSMGA